MVRIGKYNYEEDIGEYVKINKKIKEAFREFCKEKNLNKSKLIEEFYKTILLRFRDGSLTATNGYVTIDIFRNPIRNSFNSSDR